jgi:hypothetical protein
MNIEPNTVYDDDSLYSAIGLTRQTLTRARREEGLRYTRKGNRVLYLGEWVLAWLQASAEPRGLAHAN